MNDILKYNGYEGTIGYSEEDDCLVGRVLHINSAIGYAGETVQEIKEMFHQAVDDYLEMCARRGIKPEKPYKGSLNVRIGAEKHTKLAMQAARKNMTINALVCQAIDAHLSVEETKEVTKTVQLSARGLTHEHWSRYSLEFNQVRQKITSIQSEQNDLRKGFINVQ